MTHLTPGRPKLLIVITLAEIGGAQTCVADLLPALTRDYDVTVAAHGDGPLRAAIREAGATSIELRQLRRRIGLRDLAALLELVRLIRTLRPAIVHTHSSKAGIVGRFAAAICRTRVVLFTAHGWAFKAEPGLKSRSYLWADRLGAASRPRSSVSRRRRDFTAWQPGPAPPTIRSSSTTASRRSAPSQRSAPPATGRS